MRKLRTRRAWFLGLVALFLFLFGGILRESVRDWWWGENRDFVPVQIDTGWVAIGDEIDVRLDGRARFAVRAFRQQAPRHEAVPSGSSRGPAR